jgi:hypothetical protein
MTERPRRSLRDFTRDLVNTPIAERERIRRGRLLPELRLRTDTPAIEIDEATSVVQALTHLREEETDTVAIREPNGEPRAIILSVDRYLELAGEEINSAPKTPRDGRLVPTNAAFERTHVDQVDPHARWAHEPGA